MQIKFTTWAIAEVHGDMVSTLPMSPKPFPEETVEVKNAAELTAKFEDYFKRAEENGVPASVFWVRGSKSDRAFPGFAKLENERRYRGQSYVNLDKVPAK